MLEILVVLTLASMVTAGIYQFWISSTRFSGKLEKRFSELMEAQIGISGMTEAIRSSRRLLYPPPGGGDRNGFSITDSAGRTLVYELEKMPDPRQPASIFVTDLQTNERKVVMKRVTQFVCRVPSVPRGRDPALIHLTLSIGAEDGRHQSLITSARLRPLDVCCPLNR